MSQDISLLSRYDPAEMPAPVAFSHPYNAAHDLIARNLSAGRGEKVAFIDDLDRCSYAELETLSNQFANALRAQGLEPEQRIFVCLHDGIALPVVFLGAIKAGVVPVLANTLLTSADYDYMLQDSRARMVFVSAPLRAQFRASYERIPTHRIVSIGSRLGAPKDELQPLLAAVAGAADVATTHPDEPCFWLYSSGSTGRPKGTVHVHSSLIATAEHYAKPVLDLQHEDVVFSAAKLFFAYGLGNSLSFPLAVGATTVLMAERPTPAAVFARLRRHRVTTFFGVPTLYAALLADESPPARDELCVRRYISAGEALPADLGKRWRKQYGVDVLDGIGSTEMLHIFLSNTPDELRYGTSGKPVPGYQARILDEFGRALAAGEIGELYIAGPTAANGYWNNREQSLQTFLGPWVRTGDKYSVDEDGFYVYAGRSDDMLKVGGIYVSPAEVEAALISHASVFEAAVVGRDDAAGLTKPAAFVVLNDPAQAEQALAEALKAHVKARLAPYKYPRWVEFVAELPKTATGKIQRFKLRGK